MGYLPMVNPKTIADRYFAAIRARNIDDLLALYADDATFVLPNGKESKGVAAIREMHQNVFKAASPLPVPLPMINQARGNRASGTRFLLRTHLKRLLALRDR